MSIHRKRDNDLSDYSRRCETLPTIFCTIVFSLLALVMLGYLVAVIIDEVRR